MPKEEIVNYLKECQKKKISFEKAKKELIKVGWSEKEINESIDMMKGEQLPPIPSQKPISVPSPPPKSKFIRFSFRFWAIQMGNRAIGAIFLIIILVILIIYSIRINLAPILIALFIYMMLLVIFGGRVAWTLSKLRWKFSSISDLSEDERKKFILFNSLLSYLLILGAIVFIIWGTLVSRGILPLGGIPLEMEGKPLSPQEVALICQGFSAFMLGFGIFFLVFIKRLKKTIKRKEELLHPLEVPIAKRIGLFLLFVISLTLLLSGLLMLIFGEILIGIGFVVAGIILSIVIVRQISKIK